MRNDARARCRVWMASATQALLEKRRQDVLDMLISCDVDPGDIPRWPEVWREEDGVHIDRFMRDESGALRRDDIGFLIEEAVLTPAVIPDWIPFD